MKEKKKRNCKENDEKKYSAKIGFGRRKGKFLGFVEGHVGDWGGVCL